jgi:hypothetical protein
LSSTAVFKVAARRLALDTHRLLCKRRQADAMSETFLGIVHVVIADSVTSDPVVPDAHGTIVPLDTDLQVGRDGDVLETFVSVCHLGPYIESIP